jgi:gem associated protein 2
MIKMNQPCLPVPRRRKRNAEEEQNEISFENIHLMDAMEYISAVMQEASTMPEYLIAPAANTQMATASSSSSPPALHRDHVPIEGSAASLIYLTSGRTAIISPPTERHIPIQCRRWVDFTLDEFSKLRMYLDTCFHEGVGGKLTDRMQLPAMKDRAGWHVFCLGQDEASGNEGSYFDDDVMQDDDKSLQDENDETAWNSLVPPTGHEPTADLLLQFDQVLIRRVLSHLSYYVQQGWPLSMKRSAWLYALCARLERPIHRDDAATLFSLLKHITYLRSKVTSLEDRTELARYNLMICVIGIYFEQGGGFHNLFTC